jgi:hypothetical protein
VIRFVCSKENQSTWVFENAVIAFGVDFVLFQAVIKGLLVLGRDITIIPVIANVEILLIASISKVKQSEIWRFALDFKPNCFFIRHVLVNGRYEFIAETLGQRNLGFVFVTVE